MESLIGSLADFEEDPDNHRPSLFDYLARVTLASRDDLDDKEEEGRVNLMTIHSAKGLEFPVVFIAGVEKDIIPHARSVEEAEANLEEETAAFLCRPHPRRAQAVPDLVLLPQANGKAVGGIPLPVS